MTIRKLLFIVLSFSASMSFAKPSLDYSKLVFIPKDAVDFLAGGDGVGNGAAPDIKKMISVESQLPSLLETCLNSEACLLSPKERALAEALLINSPDESHIQFVTSETHDQFENIIDEEEDKKYEPVYHTGSQVGDANLINSRVLVVDDERDALALLVSVYLNHIAQVDPVDAKGLILTLMDWSLLWGDSSTLYTWNQFHIQFIHIRDREKAMMFTDGRFERVYRYEDLFTKAVSQGCEIQLQQTVWSHLENGYSLAETGFYEKCPLAPSRQGYIQWTVLFEDNVDWSEFYFDNENE
ncbi:MAG: hypothetical protein AAF203_06320, partial [Pseudomonadota bacterium]